MKSTSFSTLNEVETAIAEVLQGREQFIAAVARGEFHGATIGEFIISHPHVHALYVVKVAESVPGMGKVSARRALDELGVNYLSPCLSVTSVQWETLFAGGQR
jgi:hypothetical protein